MNRYFFILMTLFTLSSLSQETRKIKIINSKNIPVKCVLYFNDIDKGYVKNNGEISIPSNCTISDKIDIQPVDTETYDGRKDIRCSKVKKEIIVYTHNEKRLAYNNAFFLNKKSIGFLDGLSPNEKKTIYAKVALASNEVYNLSIFSDSVRNEARIQAIEYTAKVLDVENATFSAHNYKVPSENLISELANFQEAKGLEVTNKIDFTTLKYMSGVNIFSVYSKNFENQVNQLKMQ
ncbi:MAG: hypothetical protein AAGC45_11330 [Bacteroidota bacterium]